MKLFEIVTLCSHTTRITQDTVIIYLQRRNRYCICMHQLNTMRIYYTVSCKSEYETRILFFKATIAF